MGQSQDDKGQEVVCEFFGIKITTKNPNVARVLTSDIKKVMNLDVQSIKTLLTEDEDDGKSGDDGQSTTGAESKDKEVKIITGEGTLLDADELRELLKKD